MRTEDGEIIYKCLHEDPTAFSLLVDKYKGSIFAIAFSKLGNFHNAEDITQEVFIKAFKNLHKLRRWDSFLAWLCSITYNLCKDKLRSELIQAKREQEIQKSHKELNDEAISAYRQEKILQSLHEALDSLPEIYREVLTLHYLGGISGEQIAKILCISYSTARQRLARARSMLKQELLAMVGETFAQQKLGANFTFRIVEIIKKLRINPIITTKNLPWGLSFVTGGIIFVILCLNPNFPQVWITGNFANSALPSETKVLTIGEIPVDLVKTSKVPILSSSTEKGKIQGYKQHNEDTFFSQYQSDPWVDKGDMPTARFIQTAGVVDGKIYIFGGTDETRKTLTSVEAYDPITGEWTKRADMPSIRCNLSVSVVDDKVYIIGGWRSEYGINLSILEEYDPKTDTWTRKADMPTPRSALSTSVVNGKIYAIGGNGGSRMPAPTLPIVEEYDPKTDTWTRKADMPTPRGGLCTAVVNGKIYAIGGVTGMAGGGDPLVRVVEEYDPIADVWTRKKALMPTPRVLFSVSVVNGKIYAIGGGDRSVDVRKPYYPDPYGVSTVEVYDPEKDEWTRKADMPTRRFGLATAVVNGKIYAFGGADTLSRKKVFTKIEEYTP